MHTLETKDIKRRDVRIVVGEMVGAIVSVYVNGRQVVDVALTADECRALAASLNRCTFDAQTRGDR